MKYMLKNMDLLSVPQGYYIAHCISADFALGAGVAKQIDSIFNMRESLRLLYPSPFKVPSCLPVGNVFNLVTKERYWQKPTLDSLREAVGLMKACAVKMGVKKIAMPKIGCGLDKLDWEDVTIMIQDVFSDTDIRILVCYL
ncbi:MAG: macro domain-containing protein [Clostridia bacterium]|nr:macro domain-containing protein [Clostridia bacterium]